MPNQSRWGSFLTPISAGWWPKDVEIPSSRQPKNFAPFAPLRLCGSNDSASSCGRPARRPEAETLSSASGAAETDPEGERRAPPVGNPDDLRSGDPDGGQADLGADLQGGLSARRLRLSPRPSSARCAGRRAGRLEGWSDSRLQIRIWTPSPITS